jgi:hypothetical protein
MPSVSKKQHGFMAAVANNPKFAKKVGVSKSVGEEFMKADKGRKFKAGGLKEVDSDSNPGLSKLPTEVRNKMGYMKKGGDVKKKMRKFQDGGETARESYGGIEYLKSLTRAEQPKSGVDRLRSDIKATGRAGMAGAKAAAESIPVVRGAKELASRVGQKSIPKSYDEERGMKKGGKVHSDIAKDKPMMKKVAAKAVKGHEKRMHGMAGGGKVGQLSKADGCATKGKSKGKMVKMKYGGAC